MGTDVRYSLGKKFDLQLRASEEREKELGGILSSAKIELKTETHQWEQTGNICIEYECNGKPSGIAATEADFWVHELRRDGETLMYLWLPVDRLKTICRKAYAAGKYRVNAGDGGRSKVVLLRLSDLLALL